MSPQAQQQVQGTQQDEQAIRNLATEFVSAWNKNDSKALGACFAPDGDLINPSGRVGRGQREVERILSEEQNGIFKGTHMNMPQKHLRFLKQDLAIADYDFEVTRVRGANGKESTMKGLISSVLRKEGDKWLIAACRPMIPAAEMGAHH